MADSLMVGYDLNKTGKDYAGLIDAIKSTVDNWWHCLDSTWIVKTSLSPVELRDILRQHIDANDELLVAKLTGAAAWAGFNEECSAWLKNNL